MPVADVQLARLQDLASLIGVESLTRFSGFTFRTGAGVVVICNLSFCFRTGFIWLSIRQEGFGIKPWSPKYLRGFSPGDSMYRGDSGERVDSLRSKSLLLEAMAENCSVGLWL